MARENSPIHSWPFHIQAYLIVNNFFSILYYLLNLLSCFISHFHSFYTFWFVSSRPANPLLQSPPSQKSLFLETFLTLPPISSCALCYYLGRIGTCVSTVQRTGLIYVRESLSNFMLLYKCLIGTNAFAGTSCVLILSGLFGYNPCWPSEASGIKKNAGFWWHMQFQS